MRDRLLHFGVPLVLLAGGIVAASLRARAGIVDAQTSAAIAVITLSALALLLALIAAQFARRNDLRATAMREKTGAATTYTFALTPDLVHGLLLIAGESAQDAVGATRGTYGCVGIGEDAIHFWAGARDFEQFGQLQRTDIVRSRVGSWLFEGRQTRCVVIDVKSRDGDLVSIPIAIAARGPWRLLYASEAQLTQANIVVGSWVAQRSVEGS